MSDYYKPMQRTAPQLRGRPPIVAYDFETTNIPNRAAFGPIAFRRNIVEIARQRYGEAKERYEQIAGPLRRRGVRPGWYYDPHTRRERLAGEWDDVPTRFLDLRGRRTADGDIDDRATPLGFADGEALRTWLCDNESPPRLKDSIAQVTQEAYDEGAILDTEVRSIEPRYLTAYGEYTPTHKHRLLCSARVDTFKATTAAFRTLWRDLLPGTQLFAYNANRFDLRLFMQALASSEFTLEPFASRVAGLRGAVVRLGRKRVYLLDPIAALGMNCNLATFLAVFAPKYPKGELDFESTSFDGTNPAHVAYAENDSRALFFAMRKASSVVRSITGQTLRPTIGSLAIRAFMSRMPKTAILPALRPECYDVIRRIVMRGGYVVSRKYKGPLWSYDINQAYAFAMRECKMPAGRALPVRSEVPNRPGCYRVFLWRTPSSPVPYVVREIAPPYTMRETFGTGIETWLTNDEIACLRSHHWVVDVKEGYVFERSFSMRSFVNGLEARRKRYDSKHPVNVLCKSVGNNAYGKTLQEAVDTRIVLSNRRPKNGAPLCEASPEAAPIPGFWIVPETKDTRRKFERPQIGAWITAYVRTTIFDAIMLAPDSFVKADTDSVAFTHPVELPISTWRYGAWKIESDGDEHIVVAKKVYWSEKKHAAKGMRIKHLTGPDYERWYLGDVPEQEQVQLMSWRKGVLAPTWRVQKRRGTAVP